MTRWWWGGAVLITLAVVAALVIRKWPFTKRAVIRDLENVSSASVEVRDFRIVLFPRPGCIAEGIVIHHPDDPSGPPLLTISRLTVQSGYLRLLRLSKDVNFIHTEGMHIRIRAGKQQAPQRRHNQSAASITIDTLVADRTLLEFESKDRGKSPFLISVHHTRLSPVSTRDALSFDTDLHIPTPPGEIHASGRFGPWNAGDAFATPVTGSYFFHNADLSFAESIGGILQSRGEFRGSIRHLDVADSAQVAGFEVTSASHPVGLTVHFQATVNGETGDTVLESLEAHFRNSDITGNGSVASAVQGGDKVVSLVLAVPRGRIEDFLYLFSRSARPGLAGNLSLQTKILLPTTSQPFLKRLRMDGPFRIASAHFTSPSTQQSLDRIRDRSRGEPPDYGADAVSNLRGAVAVRQGLALLREVFFESSGASARLSGTYNLLDTRVDMHGIAHVDTTLSGTAKGLKSFFLKVLDPFFKSRRQRGSDVPIRLKGTYGHASLGLSLGHKE